MVTSNYDFARRQKEASAVMVMRDAVGKLASREGLSYEEAFLRFASSCVYEALFDFDTGIWKESAEYLADLYEHYGKKKSA